MLETMDSQSSYNDLPWQLIVQALQDGLSPEENLRFGEWLAASPGNRERYERLLSIWKEGLTGYPLYQAADETQAWEALRKQLGTGLIRPDIKKKPVPMVRWMAAAVLLLLAGGVTWWYTSGQDTVQYATAAGEQKQISLPDGSRLVLKPQTHLQLAKGYNRTERKVVLLDGSATFDVSHQEQRPFIVDMDAASVRDIGTSFTITKTKDSIMIAVSEGKVAFTAKETAETRELSAGATLCLYEMAKNKGEMKISGNTDPLNFDNASLSDVIAALQKKYGMTILLQDSSAGQKRLTVHLDGESLEEAVKVVCASLNLEYISDKGNYILKNSKK
ncbi:MAG: FecR domain-containing protein [Bacteroidetes bacterium]|nr:FecR domain-containing protein [Bacteroidota bacterium]